MPDKETPLHAARAQFREEIVEKLAAQVKMHPGGTFVATKETLAALLGSAFDVGWASACKAVTTYMTGTME